MILLEAMWPYWSGMSLGVSLEVSKDHGRPSVYLFLMLPVDHDVKLSATASWPCLSASCQDNHGPTL